jgi:superfamily II DNA or RNA helicase
MQLRKHQAEIATICQKILEGENIRSVVASVTPGGGKSALPVILAYYLIPFHAERLLWVVPRNSLKYQGEAEFVDPRWNTVHRLRAINGNEEDPARGNGGYITTYQAIGQNPGIHSREVERHRYIVFFDEIHHVAQGSSWEAALAPLVEAAVLVVFASGTLVRGDGQPIAFLPYEIHGIPDLAAADAPIRYTRSDALRDGAIAPVHFHTLDGSAEWENEDGSRGSVESLEAAGDYSPQALFTALRTEYALELLWMCWRDYEREARSNPLAQMLVVAPSIKLAREYRNVLSRQIGIDVPIATSEDSKRARETIAAYRRGVYPVIVTVAMAYEGLSVPQISHIACLTHIRSVPWLEQCFARANRLAPGKTAGYIYGPADRKFLQAIHDIEAEQDQAIKEREGRETGEDTEEERTGETRPWINPLHSGVHEAGSFEELTFPPPRDFAPSELEKALRDQIRHLRRHVLNNTRRGNILSKTRIWNAIVRKVADKKIDEMNLSELEEVWITLRARFGGEL